MDGGRRAVQEVDSADGARGAACRIGGRDSRGYEFNVVIALAQRKKTMLTSFSWQPARCLPKSEQPLAVLAEGVHPDRDGLAVGPENFVAFEIQ